MVANLSDQFPSIGLTCTHVAILFYSFFHNDPQKGICLTKNVLLSFSAAEFNLFQIKFNPDIRHPALFVHEIARQEKNHGVNCGQCINLMP